MSLQGRSVHSCHKAFSDLAGTPPGPDYRRPPLPTAGSHSIMYPGPEATRKRPLQPDPTTPMGRLIQPRPPPQPYASEYIQTGGPAYASSMASASEPANKKKRGRPTKAEAQQRAQEAAARGEIYPQPRKGRTSMIAPPEPSPLGSSSDARQSEQLTPPHQSTPGQLGPAMTPQQQIQPEQGPESSSGKRRRMKPHPLELEKPHHSMGEMESPLAYGSADPARSQAYSRTPISGALPSSAESRDRDIRMEGVEETQPRTTTPHSFKDTVGI